MAQRASISRTTLGKVEKGDPGVQFGIYATVLFVLGMTNRIAELADVHYDETGLALENERLPQRIRLPSSRPYQEKSGKALAIRRGKGGARSR